MNVKIPPIYSAMAALALTMISLVVILQTNPAERLTYELTALALAVIAVIFGLLSFLGAKTSEGDSKAAFIISRVAFSIALVWFVIWIISFIGL